MDNYDDFDYKTDIFDDDEEEEELKFSDTESDEEDIFSDEYLDEDDGIVVDVSETISLDSASMENTANTTNSTSTTPFRQGVTTSTPININNTNGVVLNTSSVC